MSNLRCPVCGSEEISTTPEEPQTRQDPGVEPEAYCEECRADCTEEYVQACAEAKDDSLASYENSQQDEWR